MMKIRKGDKRGRFKNTWLDARFSFSFGGYLDPEHDGYSDLMALNEDLVQPGKGFGAHSHADIEAISYPLSGSIEHRDSKGNVARMRPGDVQRMTAGRGITHSEMNASVTEPEHHLQFWIAPSQHGLDPGYEQRSFAESEKINRLRLIASPDGRDGSLLVHQDTQIFASILRDGAVAYAPRRGRHIYLHVARGAIRANGIELTGGDGAMIQDEPRLDLEAAPRGEVLLFDLR